MNIIIVGRAHAAPRRIDLDSRRGRFAAAAIVSGCMLGLVLLGALGGALLARVHGPAGEIAALRASSLKQGEQLANLDNDSHRNLDALAVQLGRLEAQATRLNALGERLTRLGKLDDGEFDFASPPAIGGPEQPSGKVNSLPIQNGIDGLRAEFDRQNVQLELLENLLRDRKIDNALLPRGLPVAQGYISSGFGERTDPLDGHPGIHLGVDFAAPVGSEITAVASGVVTWSGQRSGYGNVVEIDHGNGYMTRYAHNALNLAQVGTRVREGDVIARVGSTGRSTGAHCHFEVWMNGRPVNPMTYVKATRASRG